MMKSARKQEVKGRQLRTSELALVKGGSSVDPDAGSTNFHPGFDPLGQKVIAPGPGSEFHPGLDPYGAKGPAPGDTSYSSMVDPLG